MQAIAKGAIAEFSKGLSTGLLLWFGQPACPACNPVVHCAEALRIPDCVCDSRVSHSINPKEKDWGALIIVGLLCLCIGYLLGRLHSAPTIVGSPQVPSSLLPFQSRQLSIGKGKWGLRDASSSPTNSITEPAPLENQR